MMGNFQCLLQALDPGRWCPTFELGSIGEGSHSSVGNVGMRNPQVQHRSAFVFSPAALRQAVGKQTLHSVPSTTLSSLSADAFVIVGDNVLCEAEGSTPSGRAVLRAVIPSQGVYPDLPPPHSC